MRSNLTLFSNEISNLELHLCNLCCLQGGDDGDDDEKRAKRQKKAEEGVKQFIAHVPVPSQKDVRFLQTWHAVER